VESRSHRQVSLSGGPVASVLTEQPFVKRQGDRQLSSAPSIASVLPLTLAIRRRRRESTGAMIWMSFITNNRSCRSCATTGDTYHACQHQYLLQQRGWCTVAFVKEVATCAFSPCPVADIVTVLNQQRTHLHPVCGRAESDSLQQHGCERALVAGYDMVQRRGPERHMVQGHLHI
jgi:hypothetical protein